MAIPDVAVTRYGDEIKGGSALDVNNTAVTYVPTATGNTANLNSVVTDPNGDAWIIDANGDAKKVGTVSCQAFYDTQTFTATAGQTSFTLINAPSGDVRFSRNGASLHDAAANVVGNVVTYVPAQNGNIALLAGDRIEISYVYNICSGGATPTVVDGSETKVIAGTNITVTGSGTAGSPYTVSLAASKIGSYAQLTNTGAITTGLTAGSKVNLVTLDATWGTMVVPNTASATMTLKAGGVYRIDAGLLALFSTTAAGMRYGIYANGTKIGTTGTGAPISHTTNNGQMNNFASAYLAPTADTTIEVRIEAVANGPTQIGGFNLSTAGRDCFFSAHCIGLQ